VQKLTKIFARSNSLWTSFDSHKGCQVSAALLGTDLPGSMLTAEVAKGRKVELILGSCCGLGSNLNDLETNRSLGQRKLWCSSEWRRKQSLIGERFLSSSRDQRTARWRTATEIFPISSMHASSCGQKCTRLMQHMIKRS
jgi:hypothetical protein